MIAKGERFELGQVVATPGALEALEKARGSHAVFNLLHRHVTGDWGQLDEHDKRENDLAVREGNRILSNYPIDEQGTRIWVITEADRSVTTLLLPEEY